MSYLLASYNDKGGVKKSSFLIHLTTYLKAQGTDFHPVDLDTKKGTTSRIFPPPIGSRVSPEPLLQSIGKSAFPELMESLFAGTNLAIDCGANTTPGWITLFRDTAPHLKDEMIKHDVRTTIVIPLTSDPDTYRSIDMAKEVFPAPTIILALAPNRGEQWPSVPPGFPPTQVIRVEPAPSKLIDAYLSMAKPIDELARLTFDQPQMRAIPAMARNYIQHLHGQFDIIKSLILR